MTDRELLQHEFIDTTAKWGRDFVEVLNPLEENAILRFYHEPPQQLEPKPVAWCIVENGRVHGLVKTKPAVMNAEKWQPLYTAPPKKEWVGLTKEECFELCVKHKDSPFSLLLAVQDKIREKNDTH